MKITFVFFLFNVAVSIRAVPLVAERKNTYFIQLKDPETIEKLCSQDDNVKAIYHLRQEIKDFFSFGNFEAITGQFSEEVISRISKNSLVEYISEDFTVNALDLTLQDSAPSHLVRISQEKTVSVGQQMNFYYLNEHAGKGVTAFVIDSGVNVDHPQFENRAYMGPNFSNDLENVDYIGHGTHVAGVMGSKIYGVAKQLNIHSVKVLDRNGQGTLSSVIAGLAYSVKQMLKQGVPAVANLSLGAPRSRILDAAIQAAYKAGLVVVAAAGNNNGDACQSSPARSPYSITVGAINDYNDHIAHFSNWGDCVDIFAGGVNIVSLNHSNDDYNAVQVLSGTSMASPIVAGLVAILFNEGFSSYDVKNGIKEQAIINCIPHYSIELNPGSPNRIASSGIRPNYPVKINGVQINSTIF
ncbi:Rrt12 protein [Martiniozyma asiatica (nom. inval.)]|nr:Rrt12 protein [Martiniozyma asiatica]